MGRGAEAEGAEQVAELDLLLLGVHTQHFEHLRLEILLVDSDRTAAKLDAIQNDVVGDGADLGVFPGFERGDVLGLRGA